MEWGANLLFWLFVSRKLHEINKEMIQGCALFGEF